MDEEIRPDDRAMMKKLHKVRLTVASMMRQRGYYDPQQHLTETETYEDFEAKYQQQQIKENFLYFKLPDLKSKLYVGFEKEKVLDDGTVDRLIQKLHSGQVEKIVLLLHGDPNNTKIVEKKARTKIDQISSMKEHSIELFNMDDLVYDITKHELVPQHFPITEDEKKQLLIKYRLTETQLPRVLLSDPVAKFLGMKHGDVVKIVRKSETAGMYVTYRMAV